jgi:hypothetical protein
LPLLLRVGVRKSLSDKGPADVGVAVEEGVLGVRGSLNDTLLGGLGV